MIRIAHISDLHFASPTFSPLQFFSKRWVGNCYQIFMRYKQLNTASLEQLAEFFVSLQIDYVFITGDLTTTSRTKELLLASEFVEQIESRGIQAICIPGNHDHYTKSAWKKKKFYTHFSDHRTHGYSLKDDGVALIPLREGWSLIALDTALATPLTSSQGLFDPKTESALCKIISSLPAKENILIMNHFPIFNHEKPKKTLLRSEELREVLKRYPNIRFYLHGHTHTHCIADLRPSHYPIVLDSGSISNCKGGTWNYLELTANSASVQVFRSSSNSHEWNASEPTHFQWTTHEAAALV